LQLFCDVIDFLTHNSGKNTLIKHSIKE